MTPTRAENLSDLLLSSFHLGGVVRWIPRHPENARESANKSIVTAFYESIRSYSGNFGRFETWSWKSFALRDLK